MEGLSITDAVAFVRASIDEIALSSDMLTDETLDDKNMTLVVTNLMPEAINTVVLAAPLSMIDGEDAKTSCTATADTSDAKVLHITLENKDILRLVRFKTTDSDVVLVDMIDEASPEGRMQLNKYLRGTHDSPALVRKKVSSTDEKLTYCSLASEYSGSNAKEKVESFMCFYRVKNVSGTSVNIPKSLRNHILNYLTGLVLETYGEADKAKLFIERSVDMLK